VSGRRGQSRRPVPAPRELAPRADLETAGGRAGDSSRVGLHGERGPPAGPGRRAACRDCQGRGLSHPPPLVCHPRAGGRVRVQICPLHPSAEGPQATPSSRATCATGRPEVRASRTASSGNSRGLGSTDRHRGLLSSGSCLSVLGCPRNRRKPRGKTRRRPWLRSRGRLPLFLV